MGLSRLSGLFAVAATLVVVNACSPRAQEPVRTIKNQASQADNQTAGTEAGFRIWLDGMKVEARQAGISANTVNAVLARAQFLPRSLELDQKQPEFSRTIGEYFALVAPESRVAQAQNALNENRSLLARLEQAYGVPAPVLVAFWGLESNFGQNLGTTPIIDTLATLAYDGRRGAFFKAQLLDALRILDGGHVHPESMIGSWAGAMGQTQFMPSTFRQYAVDGDGNGWIDPWGSVTDALASGANYLSNLGWDRSMPWGREVVLPEGFDYSATDLGNRRAVAQWSAIGVRLPSGAALPDSPTALGAILVPAGHRGPAFIVYDNFETILKWNRSINYALAVGYLSDRAMGKPPLVRAFPPDDRSMRTSEIMEIQTRLNAMGYQAGTPDGMAGAQTRTAIRQYQTRRGLVADGYANASLFNALTQNR